MKLPLTLNIDLGTLIGDLDSSPFDRWSLALMVWLCR